MRAAGVLLALLALAACDPPPVPKAGARSGTRGDPFGARPSSRVGRGAVAYRAAHALVVGVSRYDSPSLGSLKGTTHDAEEVAALLASRYGMKTTLLVGEVTRPRILEALAALKKDVGRDDALFFFYAGHGVPGRLVPSDAAPTAQADPSTWKNLVTFAELGAALRACDAHHTLVLLDCCFSGSALAESAPLREAVGTLGEPSLHVAEGEENLARVFNRRAFQVLTAGTGEEEVDDLARISRAYGDQQDLEKHSPFTGALLQGLRGLTGRPDGRVLASDLGYYLSHTLVNEGAAIKAKQKPLFGALGGGDGEFLFMPVQRVLNPRLVTPLYMPGAEYAELRASAAAALTEFVETAEEKDREELARAAAPHLARLLRDDAPGPRMDAARAVRRLAPRTKDVARCVPALTATLAGAAPDEEKDVAGETLGALAEHADQAAVDAFLPYARRLRVRFQEKLAAEGLALPEPWPKEFRERYDTLRGLGQPGASPPAFLAYLEKFRAVDAWSLGPGLDLIRTEERRHQEGKAILAAAEGAIAGKRFLDARRAALRAGSLLRPDSQDAVRAEEILRTTPDVRPLWRVAAPTHHEDDVLRLTLSGDGRRLASWGPNGTIRWWNTAGGALEGELPQAAWRMVDFALSEDGRLLSWATRAGSVEIWDLQRRESMGRRQLPKEIGSFVALDATTPTVAVGTFDGRISVIDFRRPQEQDVQLTAVNAVTQLKVHRASRTLISYGRDSHFKLWSLETLKFAGRMPSGDEEVAAIVVDDPREELIWAGNKGSLYAGSLKTRETRGVGRAPSGPNGLVLDPGGKRLIVSRRDYGLQCVSYPEMETVWANTSTKGYDIGAFQGLMAERGADRNAEPLACAADGTLWVARGGSIAALRADTGREPPGAVLGGRPVRAAFSPDGRTIASAGSRLIFWDGGAPRAIDHAGQLSRALWVYPDGRRALAVLETTLASLEMASEKVLWQREIEKGPAVARLSPDGSEVIFAEGNRLRVLDAATGAPRREFAFSRAVSALAPHPGGRFAAIGMLNGDSRSAVSLVDLADGREIWRRPAGNAYMASISALAFDPDGALLAAGNEAGWVGGFLVSTGESARFLGTNLLDDTSFFEFKSTSVRELAFSPDGRHLAAAAGDVRIWDVRKKHESLRFSPSPAGTLSAAYSPDGRSLLTVGLDGSLSLWRLGLEADTVRLPAAPDGAARIELSPEGDVYLSGRGEGLFVCSARTGEVLRKLPADSPDNFSFSLDGRRFAAMTKTGFRVFDRSDGTERAAFPGVKGGQISPDGERVLTFSDLGGDAYGLDGKKIGGFGSPTADKIQAAVFVLGGEAVLFGDSRGEFGIWYPTTDRMRGATNPSGREVFFLSASKDGRRAVGIDLHGKGILLDLESGRTRPIGAHRREGLSYAELSPDGRSMLFCWNDGAVCVWDVDRDAPRLHLWLDVMMPRLTWHPDGRRAYGLASGWNDVRIFDLADVAERVPPAPGLSASLKAPEGRPVFEDVGADDLVLGCRDPRIAALLDAKAEAPVRRAVGRRLAEQGALLLDAGRLDAARALFEQAKARGYDAAPYQAALEGVERAREGRWAEAGAAFGKAAGLDPQRRFLLRLAAARKTKDAEGEKALWADAPKGGGALGMVVGVAKGEITEREALVAGPPLEGGEIENEGRIRAWLAILGGAPEHAEEAKRLLKAGSLELELLR